MTARRAARALTSPLRQVPDEERGQLPDELRYRPPQPFTIAELVAWKARRREWMAAHGLLNQRGVPEWHRITRNQTSTAPSTRKG